MKTITSPTNPFIKDLMKLYDSGERKQKNKFLVEGYHLVNEAKQAGVLDIVLISNEDDFIDGVTNILVTNDIINKLSKTKTPQGIMGVCNIKKNQVITGSKFLLLDNVSDPGNLGTIIRTALGFNIDSIIISPDSVDIYNDKVIRSTQGALFKIPIIEMDIISAINKLKQDNIYIIGSSLNNSVSLKTLNKVDKYAIILGNEAQGITAEVLSNTDINVKIEINEQLESLNVAIAGAILLFYLS